MPDLDYVQKRRYSDLEAGAQPKRVLMMNSTLRNQQQSVLLCLPGELRNKIYNYALAINRYRGIYVRKLGGGVATDYQSYKGGRFKGYDPVVTILGLTETCHQTHAETRLLPFMLNVFYIGTEYGVSPEQFGPCVKAFTAAQQAAMTSIVIGDPE
ncbi:hypothetical protein EJ07DRAFT_177234 [Lizonia empirigonia]|nr:hypothetical protein EJ07DRAFT_177234 [Lizonia empirigonia]